MATPPVFSVDDLQSDLPDDFREASETYWSCGFTWAFDQSFCKPERYSLIQRYLAGEIPSLKFGEGIRDWIIWQYGFRSGAGMRRMESLVAALSKIRSSVTAIPQDERLEEADCHRLHEMAEIYRELDISVGVEPEITSTILATLRPALFPIWDIEIASAYGFAPHSASYRRYIGISQEIVRRAAELWRIPAVFIPGRVSHQSRRTSSEILIYVDE